MKKHGWFLITAGVVVCSSAMAAGMTSDANELPPGHPPLSSSGSMGGAPQGIGGAVLSGVITETMDTGNYTYILVKTDESSIWAAAERFNAVVGDRIVIPQGMLVRDFESPSLGRTFEEIYFADSVQVVGPGAPAETGADTAVKSVAENDEVITPPENGVTIADVHARRNALAGSTVKVRGRVVKYTERVMGQNWLHIVDGSGKGAASDLTISTLDKARLGDMVTVEGPVAIDEDLGHGYFYEVLIKGGSVTRE